MTRRNHQMVLVLFLLAAAACGRRSPSKSPGTQAPTGPPGPTAPDPTTPSPPATGQIEISPTQVSVFPDMDTVFQATVSGTADHGVIWTLVEGPAAGVIDDAGRFHAPSSPGAFHVAAALHADPARVVYATVLVKTPPVVAIQPASTTVMAGRWQRFTAQVTGGDIADVAWSIEEAMGGIDSDGNYLAPSRTGTFHVVATSKADPMAKARATVDVVPLPGPVPSETCPPPARPAGFCDGSWCWDYPAPMGMTLTSVAVPAADEVWAGGDSFVVRRKGAQWARFPAPGRVGRLWANPGAGIDLTALVDGAGIFHFDGVSWAPSLPGAVADMAFVDGANAYAVRDNAVLRWDGRAWAEQFRASEPLLSIAAPSPADAWAVGESIAVHGDRSGWSEAPHGLTSYRWVSPFDSQVEALALSRVFAIEPGEIWAAGQCGSLGRHDAAGWGLLFGIMCGFHSQGWPSYGASTTVAPGDTWIATDDLQIWGGYQMHAYFFDHYRNSDYDVNGSQQADQRINDIAAAGGAAYAVGAGGSVWKLEDARWTKQTGSVGREIGNLWVDDCGRALSLALRPVSPGLPNEEAVFLRNDGTGWGEEGHEEAGSTPHIEPLWAAAFDDAWAALGGTLWHRDRAGWSRALVLDDWIVDLSGGDASDVWAIGADPWSFDGSQWSKHPLTGEVPGPLGPPRYGRLWVHAADDVWLLRAADTRGPFVLWHWDGTDWTVVPNPPGHALTAVGGDDSGPTFAATDASDLPVAFRRAQGGWSAGAPFPESERHHVFSSIHRLPRGDFVFGEYQAGLQGRAVRWDGTAFTSVVPPQDSPSIRIVRGDGLGRFWIGTDDGIFRSAP